MRRLVEHAPASGGLALWMRHRDVEAFPGDAKHAAAAAIANDGRTLYYRASFEALPLSTQTGLVAHQVLHVALRHVARFEALVRIGLDVDPALWNIAADAIVNSSLDHLGFLTLPDGAVKLDELLARTLAIDAPPGASLLRWDTESLYRAIDDRRRGGGSGRSRRGGGSGTADDAGTSPARSGSSTAHGSPADDDETDAGAPRVRTDEARTDDSSAKASFAETSRARDSRAGDDGPRAATARALGRGTDADLLPGDGASARPEDEATLARDWSERLGRAHAADGPQSLLRELLADRTMPRTPWQQVLRTRLARSIAAAPALSWSRPSRSWIANRGRTAGGKRLPWQPGTGGSRPAPRLVLIVDLSGSIEDGLLARFAAEIDRLVRVHRASVLLIAGDDRVREVRLLRPGELGRRELVAAGGGGTDFRPLLDAADAHRPDLVIVLTDLDGPAGDPRPWPVVWATPAASEAPLPWGSRLLLE